MSFLTPLAFDFVSPVSTMPPTTRPTTMAMGIAAFHQQWGVPGLGSSSAGNGARARVWGIRGCVSEGHECWVLTSMRKHHIPNQTPGLYLDPCFARQPDKFRGTSPPPPTVELDLGDVGGVGHELLLVARAAVLCLCVGGCGWVRVCVCVGGGAG